MSIERLFSILKGGAGSGNKGHAGRPGYRGGSQGTISSFTQQMVDEVYNQLPAAISESIAKVELYKGKGPKYLTDSGNPYDAKAEYDWLNKTIHIYNVEDLDSSDLQDIMFHEGGHALYDKLFDQGKLGSFEEGLRKGEKGVTPYSKAINQPSEIFAEFSRVYGAVKMRGGSDQEFLDQTKASHLLAISFLQSLR